MINGELTPPCILTTAGNNCSQDNCSIIGKFRVLLSFRYLFLKFTRHYYELVYIAFVLIVLVKKSNLSRWNGNGKYCFYWGSICCLRLWSDSALLWAGESRHWRWAVSLQLDYLPPPAGGGSSLCLHTGKSRGAQWSFFYRFVMQYRLSFGPLSVS